VRTPRPRRPVNRRLGVGLAVGGVTVLAIGAAVPMIRDDQPDAAGTARGSGDATAPATGSATPQPLLLLPNLRSMPPENIHIRGTGDARELRFSGVLGNFGPGPLEVAPTEGATCPPGQRRADQAVYHDADGDGEFTREVDRVPATGWMHARPSNPPALALRCDRALLADLATFRRSGGQ